MRREKYKIIFFSGLCSSAFDSRKSVLPFERYSYLSLSFLEGIYDFKNYKNGVVGLVWNE